MVLITILLILIAVLGLGIILAMLLGKPFKFEKTIIAIQRIEAPKIVDNTVTVSKQATKDIKEIEKEIERHEHNNELAGLDKVITEANKVMGIEVEDKEDK